MTIFMSQAEYATDARRRKIAEVWPGWSPPDFWKVLGGRRIQACTNHAAHIPPAITSFSPPPHHRSPETQPYRCRQAPTARPSVVPLITTSVQCLFDLGSRRRWEVMLQVALKTHAGLPAPLRSEGCRPGSD